jgi:hypothetical protein
LKNAFKQVNVRIKEKSTKRKKRKKKGFVQRKISSAGELDEEDKETSAVSNGMTSIVDRC